MVITHQAQDFYDGRVTLTEGNIGTVILLSVLDVQRNDLGVVLANERDGVLIRGREVADVEIDPGIG